VGSAVTPQTPGTGPSGALGTADVILVGHGSRDPGAGAVLRRLRDAVAARLAPLRVVLAWIELDAPLLSDLIGPPETAERVAPERTPVVIPLLLSRGTHAARDLPRTATAPLGPDPMLTRMLLDRLREAGVAEGRPLVLAAAGSADPLGTLDVSRQAEMLQGAWGAPVRAGFVTSEPSLAAAAEQAAAAARMAAGHALSAAHSSPAVVSYFLAPGRLPSSARPDTEHLGSHPGLVELVLMRYRATAPDGVTRLGL
jgi:sirohydrochlorin ferrochelatase